MSPLFLAFAFLQAPAEPATAPPAPAAVEEKKTCRRIDATGSRMASKRECRTAAEWKTIDRQAGQGFGGLSGTQGRQH